MGEVFTYNTTSPAAVADMHSTFCCSLLAVAVAAVDRIRMDGGEEPSECVDEEETLTAMMNALAAGS